MKSIEPERKFLLLRSAAEIVEQARIDGTLLWIAPIAQCYLPGTGDWTIRVRREQINGETRFLQTMKRRISEATSDELEMEVAQDYYDAVAARCGAVLTKTRSVIFAAGREWEIDVFHNPELKGIEFAEIELEHEDEVFDRPDWLGKEVTSDPGYRNASLARRIAGGA